MYQKYYNEAYKIAEAMTLDQKIGQTIQADLYSITHDDYTDPAMVEQYHFGSVLVGGNGCPDANGNLINMPYGDEAKTI